MVNGNKMEVKTERHFVYSNNTKVDLFCNSTKPAGKICRVT